MFGFKVTPTMERNIVEEYLKETYENNPNSKVNVVEEKRKKFAKKLQKAEEYFLKNELTKAKDTFLSIITWIHDDPYPDELNLDKEQIFLIKSRYCLSWFLEKKGTNLGINKESFLEKVIEDLKKNYNSEILPFYFQLLLDQACNNWSSALQQIIQIKINYAMRKSKNETSRIDDELNQHVPTDQEILNTTDECLKMVTDLCQKKGTKTQEQEMQADMIKTYNKLIQTDTAKVKKVEAETSMDNRNYQIIRELKNKMEKDAEKTSKTLTTLYNKIAELNSKIGKEVNGVTKVIKEETDKKCQRYEEEIQDLKRAVREAEKLKDLEIQKNVKLQKILLDQLNDKYNAQKYIAEYLNEKCTYMINFLNILAKHLSLRTVPDLPSAAKEQKFWHEQLGITTTHLNALNETYKKIKYDFQRNEECFQFSNWPELIKIPKDEDNIIFNSFLPAIRHILDIEHKISTGTKANNNSNHVQSAERVMYCSGAPYVSPQMSNSTVFAPAQSSLFLPATSMVPPSSRINQQPLLQPVTYWLSGSQHLTYGSVSQNAQRNSNYMTPPIVVKPLNNNNDVGEASGYSMSKNQGKINNKRENREVILKFLTDALPDIPEMDITLAFFEVLKENNNSFAKCSKLQILEEVKNMLKNEEFIKKHTPTDIELINIQIDSSCPICLDEMSFSDRHTLPCNHSYHKHCIQEWLKKKNVCPTCQTMVQPIK